MLGDPLIMSSTLGGICWISTMHCALLRDKNKLLFVFNTIPGWEWFAECSQNVWGWMPQARV